MKKKTSTALAFVVIATSMAHAEILRMECTPTNNPIIRIIEIDTAKKQVRLWAKFPQFTNGPFGPFDADISPEKIVWMDIKVVGTTRSITKYVIDREKRTVATDITYNYDQDDWHETAPCK